MNSKEIKQKVHEEGYLQAIVTFEVVGSPKDYVEKALTNHLTKIKGDKEIIILSEHIEPPEEQDKFWSTFAEVEMLVKGLEKFTWLCMNFMPASIEIMAPEELIIKGRQITGWINDLLAKMHEIASKSKQIDQQNKLMLKNVNALFRNMILLCVDTNTNKADDIAKKIGVAKKDLEPVFEAMTKEGTIKKEGKIYKRK